MVPVYTYTCRRSKPHFFTRALGTGAVTAPILPQMIAMAGSLGLEVIVEGVETEEQRRFFSADHKPLRLQGWLFSEPLSVEGLSSYLDQNDVLSEKVVAVLDPDENI
jgi:sensor c-di-GMP phosphodiesterase-like protein